PEASQAQAFTFLVRDQRLGANVASAQGPTNLNVYQHACACLRVRAAPRHGRARRLPAMAVAGALAHHGARGHHRRCGTPPPEHAEALPRCVARWARARRRQWRRRQWHA
ncbi:hypothetical protein JKP88DRAFT_162677, partial [Tribonema minus]